MKKELRIHINEIIKDCYEKQYDIITIANTIIKEAFKAKADITVAKLQKYAFFTKNKYKIERIPKKSGGYREIYAPTRGLKHILEYFNYIFQYLYEQKGYKVANGFLPNRSVATNAHKHIGKNYVFNMDLKDFFPSIKQSRVWGMLQKEPFNFERKDADLIANLLCYQAPLNEDGSYNNAGNFLPQGAPTSPIISNFICRYLDKKLIAIAKKFGAIYTRYADDITFSSNHNVYQENSEFLLSVKAAIESEGFSINEAKTRLQKSSQRQEVTGVIVNEKLNANRAYIKELRALIHILKKCIELYGEDDGHDIANEIFNSSKDDKIKRYFNKKDKDKFLEELKSKKTATFDLEKFKNSRDKLIKGKRDIKSVIAGKLNFLKMIKSDDDSTYMTLKARFDALFTKEKEHKAIHNPKKLALALANFSNDPVLKYTSHSWGNSQIQEFKNFENFLNLVNAKWTIMKAEIEQYSKISDKISIFLQGREFADKKGDHWMSFGWSANALQEYFKNNKLSNPFDFILPEQNQEKPRTLFYNGQSKNIEKFEDVCNDVFKHLIEFRGDDFFNLIMDKLKKHELLKSIKLTRDERKKQHEELKNIRFYSDTKKIADGIDELFKLIKDKADGKAKLEFQIENNDEFIKFKIINVGSKCSETAKRTLHKLQEKKGGDGGKIYYAFTGLCDWQIEGEFSDNKAYRLDVLTAKRKKDPMYLKEVPAGFTHILTFYKD